MKSDHQIHSKSGVLRLVGRAAFVSLLSVGFLSACAKDNDDVDLSAYVDTIEPPDVLYNQGLANMNAGRLKEASRKFQSLDQQHPYSEFARKANVLAAFTQYKQGQFDEAIQSSRRFLSLYPTHEDAAYAQYIIGISYFSQMPVITRDQRDTQLAIQNFNELIERYPESIYVEDAKKKRLIARDQLGGKEMQVGRYYQERREYAAALRRFRNVVEGYSNTRHIEEALARLTETYLAMGLVQEAQTAAAILGNNYPDSEWYASSYKLLQSDGLEPLENRGSWLSRAFRRA